METQLKNNQIPDLPRIPNTRYENLFNVYTVKKDGKDFYFYNITNKVVLPTRVGGNFISKTTVNAKMTWATLSYKIYGTMNLWFLLYLLNNKDNKISFTVDPSDDILYIKPAFLNSIIQKLNE